MKRTLENLISIDTVDKGVVLYPDNNKSLYLPYYRKEIDFNNERDRIEFIKDTEKIFRISGEYAAYLAYLENDVPGMNRCAKFSNITNELAPLEFHHGPIFTLWDYIEILLIYFLKHENTRISSFAISNLLVKEHFNNLIQGVMLSEQVHKAVHVKKNGVRGEFISIDQAFGDLVGFLKKYYDSISFRHINKIKNYLTDYDFYKTNDSIKNSLLKESIKQWSS
jgi:hypothetical protein